MTDEYDSHIMYTNGGIIVDVECHSDIIRFLVLHSDYTIIEESAEFVSELMNSRQESPEGISGIVYLSENPLIDIEDGVLTLSVQLYHNTSRFYMKTLAFVMSVVPR